MPTMLLYDAVGLQLFEDVTYLEEYYLTNAEIEVLENYSGEIAKLVPAGSILLELGSGYVLVSLRRNFSHNSPPITVAVTRGTPNLLTMAPPETSAKSIFYCRPSKRLVRRSSTTPWICHYQN